MGTAALPATMLQIQLYTILQTLQAYFYNLI